jgi:phosphoglucomutase
LNLITQQDSQVNLAVARESKEVAVASKQDSSAMKIIAFLTTIFLPGTYIAVCHSFLSPHPNINQMTDSLLHALL